MFFFSFFAFRRAVSYFVHHSCHTQTQEGHAIFLFGVDQQNAQHAVQSQAHEGREGNRDPLQGSVSPLPHRIVESSFRGAALGFMTEFRIFITAKVQPHVLLSRNFTLLRAIFVSDRLEANRREGGGAGGELQ